MIGNASAIEVHPTTDPPHRLRQNHNACERGSYGTDALRQLRQSVHEDSGFQGQVQNPHVSPGNEKRPGIWTMESQLHTISATVGSYRGLQV